MSNFTTLKMQIPVFTNGVYHIKAILVDCQGNAKLIDLSPSSIIKADQYFAPCSNCGVAVLQSAWYEGGDCCAFCGITMPESKPTTIEEARLFIISCINFFGGGFHPDTLGESYVNRDDMSTFNSEEAAQFNINMEATFGILGEDGIYEIINPLLGLTD